MDPQTYPWDTEIWEKKRDKVDCYTRVMPHLKEWRESHGLDTNFPGMGRFIVNKFIALTYRQYEPNI